ncbi:hypothetical protein LJC17_03210 [Acholeplasma sp. OttesenSCG-928-E16]|nr:hypothetical protein [Acholeplasma sp. OttesenSCG-928-E16]
MCHFGELDDNNLISLISSHVEGTNKFEITPKGFSIHEGFDGYYIFLKVIVDRFTFEEIGLNDESIIIHVFDLK